MLENKQECKGVLNNISAGGVRIEAETIPKLDEKIILYIEDIGRFEGYVIRVDEGSFAIKMLLSATKSKRLEVSLDAFFQDKKPNAQLSGRRTGVLDRRSQDRIGVDAGEKLIGKTEAGKTFEYTIKAISLSGIDICTNHKLTLGENVTIGKTNGYVARENNDGYVILNR